MTRRRLYPLPDSDHPNPDFVAPRKKRSRPATDSRKYEAALTNATAFCEAIQLKQEVDYDSIAPDTVVGLYILFHKWIYKTEPTELRQRTEMQGACSAVKRLIAKEFNGEIDQAFEFVRWTWMREMRQFANRDGDWRITWRYQFCSPKLVTDYRVAGAKR